jgi:hypothetical protein
MQVYHQIARVKWNTAFQHNYEDHEKMVSKPLYYTSHFPSGLDPTFRDKGVRIGEVALVVHWRIFGCAYKRLYKLIEHEMAPRPRLY